MGGGARARWCWLRRLLLADPHMMVRSEAVRKQGDGGGGSTVGGWYSGSRCVVY